MHFYPPFLKSKNPCRHLLFSLAPNCYAFPPPSIPPSISGLLANQTPSVVASPTCQEQLPAALLTILLTALPHLPRHTAGRASPSKATASFKSARRQRNRHVCDQCRAEPCMLVGARRRVSKERGNRAGEWMEKWFWKTVRPVLKV